jgi:hypothetical protein
MIELKYTGEPCEVEPYGVETLIKVPESLTATEMVQAFIRLLQMIEMCDYNIAKGLKKAYYDFIYEKGFEDSKIEIAKN